MQPALAVIQRARELGHAARRRLAAVDPARVDAGGEHAVRSQLRELVVRALGARARLLLEDTALRLA
jgi:hypothetical protein